MFRFLTRLPGIEGLPLIIVASNALVALFEYAQGGLTGYLLLNHESLMAGDVWRLLTFLFVPPPASLLFLLLWLYVLYLYAAGLEEAWGAGRFTGYYLLAAVATALVALYPSPYVVPNTYLNASLFLAFAALYPEMELLLFFVVPVKVKYLGYFTWGWMLWSFWAGTATDKLAVAAAVLSYFVYLGPDLWSDLVLRWQVYRNRRRWRA